MVQKAPSVSTAKWIRHTVAAALVATAALLLLDASPHAVHVRQSVHTSFKRMLSSSPPAPSWAWNPHPVYSDIESATCTIERVNYDELTSDDFFRFYEEKQPVILHYPPDGVNPRNSRFQRAMQKENLLRHHGHDQITLSTGNRNSYAKKNTTVADYVRNYVHPQPELVPGNVSWYHFGDPHHRYWREITELYELPKKFMHLYQDPALSFGFAGSGTGVPFHTHGAVFAEVLYGRKRWWLSAPRLEPRYDPDANTLHWLRHVRPTYSEAEAATLYECVCDRGDVIYIPSNWHHATLNIGEAVFMSVFL